MKDPFVRNHTNLSLRRNESEKRRSIVIPPDLSNELLISFMSDYSSRDRRDYSSTGNRGNQQHGGGYRGGRFNQRGGGGRGGGGGYRSNYNDRGGRGGGRRSGGYGRGFVNHEVFGRSPAPSRAPRGNRFTATDESAPKDPKEQ